MPWRRFANGELLCPVCLGLICEPTTAPACGHSFCRNCIIQSLEKLQQRCPACRTTMCVRDWPPRVARARMARRAPSAAAVPAQRLCARDGGG